MEITEAEENSTARGMVCELEPMGADVVTVLDCGEERVMAMSTPEQAYRTGTNRAVRFDPARIHLFERETGRRLPIR